MPSFYRDPDAPTPTVPRTVGVTALIERDGAFLVERRADFDVDEWAFVGGRVDDESVLEALQREVLEETGFAIEQASLFGIFSDPTRLVAYPDGNVCRITSIAFLVQPRGDAEPLPSEESREMRFVRRDELGRLPLWPAHLPIREALLAGGDSVVVA
ncbi:MAG TPA: NUDIX domain-containing protein [Gaiellaceae bacterium]|nr:NUDIX domain-containing protein [Gaiellaceae bacterium]